MSVQSALFAILNPAAADAFARHFAAALLSGLWEGVLLATAIGLCLYLFPHTAAGTRFIVWTAAFAVLAALPFLNLLLAGHNMASSTVSAAPPVQLDARWSYALAALWLAAALGRLVHLALQAARVRALWNSAVPVSTELLPELSLGAVKVCLSRDLDRPSVIGFFAPRILIPAWLFDQLTPGELEQIVLHELEHLRRRDDWVNLMQKVGLAIFPLNPALVWIDRRLATEREFACDDGVLRRTRAPRAYATCLTTLAERGLEHRRERSSRHRLTVLALGAMGAIRSSDLSRRIESILGFGLRSRLNPVAARTLAAFLVAAVMGAALTLARAPQLVSFETAAQTSAAFASNPVPSSRGIPPIQPARFENAVFHLAQSRPTDSPASRPAKPTAKPKSKSRSAPAIQIDTVYSETGTETVSRPSPRVMVLTAWHESAPQPVLVTLPDGRRFLATYTADPNQVGWLIIQL